MTRKQTFQDLTAMTSTLETSGTGGGSHERITGITRIFDAVESPAAALEPEEESLPDPPSVEDQETGPDVENPPQAPVRKAPAKKTTSAAAKKQQ